MIKNELIYYTIYLQQPTYMQHASFINLCFWYVQKNHCDLDCAKHKWWLWIFSWHSNNVVQSCQVHNTAWKNHNSFSFCYISVCDALFTQKFSLSAPWIFSFPVFKFVSSTPSIITCFLVTFLITVIKGDG